MYKQCNVPPLIAEDRAYAAQAADPNEYLTYEAASLPSAEGAVQVYTARRTGRGHILRGQECQDACLHRAFTGGIVLAMADGISECPLGGKGAQLACETAADMAEDLFRISGNEEAFARAMCSGAFHTRLRSEWLRRVAADQCRRGLRPSDEGLLQYGTTLMFAVITHEWYAAFSIGDGQILFFSESEAMPLNIAQKDSPAPHSLIYPDCIRDIRSGFFPRSAFSGVLLMTDGVNDMLDRLGPSAAHAYALQAAERFRACGAPQQPFLYSGDVGGEARTVDLSRQLGAADDCTLLLALPCPTPVAQPERIRALLKERFPGAHIRLLRRSERRAGYIIADVSGAWLVTIIPKDVPRALRDPRLGDLRSSQAHQWAPAQCWAAGPFRFCAYPLPADASLLFLGEESGTGDLAGNSAVPMFRALTALQRHLACHGLHLHPSAPWWIARLPDAHGTLLIPQEALSEDAAQALAPRDLFPGLIGWITCGDDDVPLFDPGAVSPTFPPPVHAIAESAFCIRYSAVNGAFGITNCGNAAWQFTDRSGQSADVAPGRTLTLSDDLNFTVQGIRCRVHLLPDITHD